MTLGFGGGARITVNLWPLFALLEYSAGAKGKNIWAYGLLSCGIPGEEGKVRLKSC